jgi:DNA-binding NtrC family response regulator
MHTEGVNAPVDSPPLQVIPGESTISPQSPNEKLILVVDDDPDICAAVGSVLKEAGFAICAASNGMEAIRYLATHQIKAVVTDVRMSHGNGFELLDIVRTHFPKLPLFFITGYDDVTEEDAVNKGAYGLFNKPFDLTTFVTRVRSSVDPAGGAGIASDPVH